MKKKRRKQHVRIYARIVSLFLVLTMLTNDFLGGGAIVWAAENQSSVETDAEQPAEGLTQETESDNNTQTEDADPSEEEEENGPESERDPIDEETGFEEEPAQEDESSGTASSGETEEGEIPEGETPEAAGTQDTEEEITEDTVDLETEDDFLAEDEPQTVLILEEDVTKRTSNIKYFQNEDHSYTAAIYPYPIHYEEDGEWKEIDNQLKDGEAEEGTQFLENTQNLFQVKFAKKSNGSKLVKIKMDDFQISWDLKDARKVDAAAVNGNSRSGVASVPQHKEERTMLLRI